MLKHDTRRHRARGLARRFRTATRALLLAAITSHSAGAQEVSADAGFARLAFGRCPSDLAYLNQVTGWQVAWPVEWDEIVTGRGDRSGALRRWSRAAAALDARSDSLRHRAPTRPIAPRAVVVRVLAQVDALVRTLSMDHAELLRIPGDASFERAWRSLLVDSILPAVQRHRTVLASTYMRRVPTAPGIDARRAGEPCYAAVLAFWLGEPLDVAALEATGHRLLTEAQHELQVALRAPTTLAALAAARRLRAATPATRGELLTVTRGALARAHARLQTAFQPPTWPPLAVAALPSIVESAYPAGYYRPRSSTVPGDSAAVVVNLSRPAERRTMAEAIAFHEGVPGHHLFATYPRAAGAMGSGEYNAAFAEGWALYAEQLADGLGLYTSETDRIGMLARRVWAASRLLVDHGLHARGWSRAQAIEFMQRNTALADDEIAVEVDRYIAMPGQGASYMLGYDRLMTERRLAERRLGDRLSLPDFHAAVLGDGMRPLALVARDVRRWAFGQPSSLCASREHRAFDFFLGEWDAYLTGTETQVGRASIRAEDRGCVITEYWELANGSRTGRSLNIFDAVSGQWEQFWADSDGDRTHYVGGRRDDGSIQMIAHGDRVPHDTTARDLRITFVPGSDGTVRQIGEHSIDGTSWRAAYDLTFRKRRASS